MSERRLKKTLRIGELLGDPNHGPKSKQCACGEEIDLSGLGAFAHLVDTCDACTERINAQEAEKREAEQERARRAARSRKAEETWQRIVPKMYRDTDPKHPNFPKGLDVYAERWSRGQVDDFRPWLGFIGLSGAGKTRIMSRVVRRKIKEGFWCEWVNATQFQWSAQNQHDEENGKKAKRFLESFRRCGFLAFDDLGKQRWTDTVESYFWDLVEERYAQCQPMVWTSNSALNELREMLSKDRAQPIVGRLSEASNIIEI